MKLVKRRRLEAPEITPFSGMKSLKWLRRRNKKCFAEIREFWTPERCLRMIEHLKRDNMEVDAHD